MSSMIRKFKKGDRIQLSTEYLATTGVQQRHRKRKGTVVGLGCELTSVRIVWDRNQPSSILCFHQEFLKKVKSTDEENDSFSNERKSGNK